MPNWNENDFSFSCKFSRPSCDGLHVNILKNCFRQNRRFRRQFTWCVVTYGTRSAYSLHLQPMTTQMNSNELRVRKKKEIFLFGWRSSYVPFLLFMSLWPWTGVCKWMTTTRLCFCIFTFWHKKRTATDFKEWNQFYVTKRRYYRLEGKYYEMYFLFLFNIFCICAPSHSFSLRFRSTENPITAVCFRKIKIQKEKHTQWG